MRSPWSMKGHVMYRNMLKNVLKCLLKGVGGQNSAKFGLHSFWTPPNKKWHFL